MYQIGRKEEDRIETIQQLDQNTPNGEDVKEVFSLMASVASCRGGVAPEKHLLMRGLCRLLEAEAWLWGGRGYPEGDESTLHAGYLSEGFDDGQFVSLLEGMEHPKIAETQADFFARAMKNQKPTTVGLEQLTPWGGTPNSGADDHGAFAGVSDCLLSIYPVNERSMSTIEIYRGGEQSAVYRAR